MPILQKVQTWTERSQLSFIPALVLNIAIEKFNWNSNLTYIAIALSLFAIISASLSLYYSFKLTPKTKNRLGRISYSLIILLVALVLFVVMINP